MLQEGIGERRGQDSILTYSEFSSGIHWISCVSMYILYVIWTLQVPLIVHRVKSGNDSPLFRYLMQDKITYSLRIPLSFSLLKGDGKHLFVYENNVYLLVKWTGPTLLKTIIYPDSKSLITLEGKKKDKKPNLLPLRLVASLYLTKPKPYTFKMTKRWCW